MLKRRCVDDRIGAAIDARAKLLHDTFKRGVIGRGIVLKTELRVDLAHQGFKGADVDIGARWAFELGAKFAQRRIERAHVDLRRRPRLDAAAQALDAARHFLERPGIDRRRGTLKRLIHACGELLEPALDRGQSRRRRRTFDQRARIGEQRRDMRGVGMWRRA